MIEQQSTTIEWRPCPGWDEHYAISNVPEVMRISAEGHNTYVGRILKQFLVNAYLNVHLSKNSRSRPMRVHRLVAMAFLGPAPEGKPQVNHKNGNKTDNRPENLEWCSAKEDAEHRVRMGLQPCGDRSGPRLHPESYPRGSRHRMSKLTEGDIPVIRARNDAGESNAAIAQSYGVSSRAIWQLLHGITWKHVP